MTSLPAERLHPWSWIFHAARWLRGLALPLIVVVFVGSDEGVGGLAVAALGSALAIGLGVARAWSFRFEVGPDELLIREGVLVRELRHLPLTRIQSVSERRGPLHRLLGVTELVLESGSGGEPEAVMRVLAPEAAARLAELLRRQRGAAQHAAPADAAPRTLLSLPVAELVLLGLVSNRGLVVVAVLGGVLGQYPQLLERLPGSRQLLGTVEAVVDRVAGLGAWPLVAGVVLMLLAVFLALRVFSVVHALLTQYGFTLERSGDRIRVRRGLLTRVELGGRVSGVQRLILERRPLHRLLGRCSLRVDLASRSPAAEGGEPLPEQLEYLAPIATPAQAQSLLTELFPGLELDSLHWQPLHPSAARRRWQRTLVWALPASVVLLGLAVHESRDPAAAVASGALALLLPLGSAWHAGLWARWSAHAAGHGVVVWRSGVLTRRWVLVLDDRAQTTCIERSPADRRIGTATLSVDTQGAGPSRALLIRWLAESAAVELGARFRVGRRG